METHILQSFFSGIKEIFNILDIAVNLLIEI